jgi:hypothetical protein
MAHKLLNFEEYIEGLVGGSPYMLLAAEVVKLLRMGTEFDVLVVGAGYLRKE